MTRLRIRTPSRLHFGLLGWGPEAHRQFGGVGLMVDDPGIEITAEPADEWRAAGPLVDRARRVAERVAAKLASEGTPILPALIRVERAPAEHIGLGVGTQLSLAVARLLLELSGCPEPSIEWLADLTGRGLRSGIGLHGFAQGGLIVDGGRRSAKGVPPLLARLFLPAEWSVLVVLPEHIQGIHGPEEAHAFAELPPIPEAVTDRLCRLVLLGLMPAVIERDLESFGTALTELQYHVGRCFAPAQGGLFARAELEPVVAELRAQGLHGVGQSSWGPTLYGFSASDEDFQRSILARLEDRFGFSSKSAFWTRASRQGAALARG